MGIGASFTVEFPTRFAREPLPRAVPRAASSSRNVQRDAQPPGVARSTIISTTTPTVAEMICAALKIGGADVFSAESAETGLVQTESLHPDVIICDIGMPQMDGYARSCEELRALPERGRRATNADRRHRLRRATKTRAARSTPDSRFTFPSRSTSIASPETVATVGGSRSPEGVRQPSLLCGCRRPRPLRRRRP